MAEGLASPADVGGFAELACGHQGWRITRAANRMRSERVNLSRLAESVGYNSDAVFSKAFRRVTGQSPGRYRHGWRS